MMFTGAGGPTVGRRALRARRVAGRVAAVAAAALAIIAIDAGAANASLALLKPAPADLATFSGHGGFSTDGLGQFQPGGTIQAEVPAGATVVQAYLYGTYSGTSTFDPATNATIDFDGTDVVLTGLPDVSPGCCTLNAARATVTAQVATFGFVVPARSSVAGWRDLVAGAPPILTIWSADCSFLRQVRPPRTGGGLRLDQDGLFLGGLRGDAPPAPFAPDCTAALKARRHVR
jgi:hypothetical protein